MRIGIAAVMIVAALMTIATDEARTAPRPALIPSEWEADIKIERPQPIKVFLSGQAKPTIFWYLRYTLTNTHRRDDIDNLNPTFDLYTETGQMLRSIKNLQAFNAIKKHHNDPLLKRDTNGKLLRGTDNAKRGVAIWPDFDPDAGRFDIFIGGLSGETTIVRLPKPILVWKEDAAGQKVQVKTDKLPLSKTLQISCTVSGEATERIRSHIKMTRQTWIMR